MRSVVKILIMLFCTRPALAIMEPLTVTSEDKYPAPRWMYGAGDVPKGNDPPALLAAVKKAQLDGNGEVCLKKADAAFAKATSLRSWLTLAMLDCSSRQKGSASAVSDGTHKVLTLIEKNPTWLFRGPQAPLLRQATLRAYLATLEADVKTNRARAARTIDRVQEMLSQTDEKQRARLWRWAGELAFTTQRFEAARELFRRSLSEQESEETKARLRAVEAQSKEKIADPTEPVDSRQTNTALEASKEELELVERVTQSLKSGELVSAVDDAVKIIVQFPGGNRAKWATDRISEAYWSIAEKSDPKYVLSRGQMVRAMERADGDRLAEWSRVMFNRGQWDDALALSRKALETISGARSTAILDTAAKAALATDRFDVAREFFDRLVKEHAGAPFAREALYRSALLYYRQGAFAQAAADLERFLLLPGIGQYETLARYWLWRSLQKLKSDRADAVADELMRKVPFSYFGLRARYERAGNLLEFKPEAAKTTTKLWFTESEKRGYERTELLLKAGWLEEAQLEIKELPLPQRAEDKAIRSLLWAAAGQYANASRLANEAWDEKAEFRRPPFVNVAFPDEFSSYIEAQASARKLDRYLVRGLVKQESSFNPRAVSSAGALGLMQIIPQTAKELAQDLKTGTLTFPDDLFQGPRNIQLGTYYLSRLLTRYQGNVPLALAAYNAGPTRIDRWLKSRPSLKTVTSTRSSAPDDELWLDEIPYWETSLYVKSILRNILIYKMLDQGRVQVPEPVWSNNVSESAP